jgi:formate hydrogenlyase subunit 3/multisubunit Na+/H+ antiporter MnhD subunit
MDAVFLPPVLIVCAILLGCVLVITHRRVREHADTADFGRVLFAFFGTLLAMLISSVTLGFFSGNSFFLRTGNPDSGF